jgi:hypothetical protein
MEECGICFEIKLNSKIIICDDCGKKCCNTCFIEYLKNEISKAKCIFCNIYFTNISMYRKLNKQDLKKYNEILKEYYFNIEKMQFPVILDQIERKQIKSIINEAYGKLNKYYIKYIQSYKKHEKEYKNSRNYTGWFNYKNKIKSSYNMILEHIVGKGTVQSKRLLCDNMSFYDSTLFVKYITKKKLKKCLILFHKYTDNISTKEEKNLIITCPNCYNRILYYYCTKCHINICNKCIEPMSTNHICNNENILNISLIRNDCKQCPKCNETIYKSSGCDQMWCTKCRTAFSWRTLMIQSSINRLHNPHYIEYVNNNMNIIHDNDELMYFNIGSIRRNVCKYLKQEYKLLPEKYIFDIMSDFGQLQDIILFYVDPHNQELIKYRTLYLKYRKKKSAYLNKIVQIYKKIDIDNELNILLNHYFRSCSMILNNIYRNNINRDLIHNMYTLTLDFEETICKIINNGMQTTVFSTNLLIIISRLLICLRPFVLYYITDSIVSNIYNLHM